MRRVPQEAVLRTEYLFCTGKACFLHRMLQKTLRVPQEAILITECVFRTVGGRFRYRMRIPYTPDPFYGVGVRRVVGNGCIFQPEPATQ